MSGSSLFASLGAALQAIPSPRFSFRGSSSPGSAGGGGSSSGGSKNDPVLVAFEADLSAQLEMLKSSNEEGGYLCMPWLCRAMAVVVTTHCSLESFIPDLQQALTGGDGKRLDEYLDDSVRLLDVCNVLKETLADVNSFHIYAHLALNSLTGVGGGSSLSEAKLRRAKSALVKYAAAMEKKDEELGAQKRARLEYCSSMLRRIGERLSSEEEDSSVGSFLGAVYAAQVITVFVCGVVAMSLTFKPRRPLSSLSVAGHSAWALSVGSLHQRVKEQVEKKKLKGFACVALLEELDGLDQSARAVLEIANQKLDKVYTAEDQRNIERAVANLRHYSDGLKDGLLLLEKQIGDLFQMLVGSRMVLLDLQTLS